MTVVSIAPGIYRVTDGERTWTVAVAGPPDNRWVWVDGRVTRLEPPGAASRNRGRTSTQELSAPMPATVIRIMADVGTAVSRGDTLIVLEAMKMELPIRAPRDGVVRAIHCQPGELVQPGVNLVDLS